jgi:hypothetical protein
MAEIGEPLRRIVVVPAVPDKQPTPAPTPRKEPVKVPEKEPA